MPNPTTKGRDTYPAVQIRPARPSDADGIAWVHVETWRDTYAGILPDSYLVKRMDGRIQAARTVDQLRRRHRGGETYVAEHGPGNVIGFIVSGPSRRRGAQAEIYELYVHPDHQDWGVGRRLCRAGARARQAKGAPDICVEVLEANPARFFYEALGGRQAGRETVHFAGVKIPALVYAWPDIDALISGDPFSGR